jgi:hypothetical protein
LGPTFPTEGDIPGVTQLDCRARTDIEQGSCEKEQMPMVEITGRIKEKSTTVRIRTKT